MAARRSLELLTPRGAGGVAVVAARGAERFAAVAGLLRSRGGGAFDPGCCLVPRLLELWLDGEVVDEVLAFDRPEVATFEIHLHGSDAVVAALERVVGLAPPVMAAPESLLLGARSDAQLALAFEQLEFDWTAELRALRSLPAAARRARVAAIAARSVVAIALTTPATVVICGRQNAGKSTLMNRLLFEDRVLTGTLPGLTRDPVAELTCLAGYPYLLVDTAGEGLASGQIEAAALERARSLRRGALRLLVVDAARGPEPSDLDLWNDQTLTVRNKADLDAAPWHEGLTPAVTVSCRDPADAAALRLAVGVGLRSLRGLPAAGRVGGVAALDQMQRQELADLASE